MLTLPFAALLVYYRLAGVRARMDVLASLLPEAGKP